MTPEQDPIRSTQPQAIGDGNVPASLPEQDSPIQSTSSGKSWPAVLGVIAVAVASISLLFDTWRLFRPRTLERMAQIPEIAAHWRMLIGMMGVLSLLAAVVLLICGIGLMRRRRWAHRLVWIWAVAKIFIALMSALIGYVAFEEVMRDETFASAALSVAIARVVVLLFIFVSLLWGWSLPIFFFFWFAREKIRSEMRTWSGKEG